MRPRDRKKAQLHNNNNTENVLIRSVCSLHWIPWSCFCPFTTRTYCLSSTHVRPAPQPTGLSGTWRTIQRNPSSCLAYGRPSWAVRVWAGTFTLWQFIQHFLCRPPRRPPSEVPRRMILERLSCWMTCPNHASFCLLTVARRGSCGPTSKLILFRTLPLVLCSK